jgi:hypothetical protein
VVYTWNWRIDRTQRSFARSSNMIRGKLVALLLQAAGWFAPAEALWRPLHVQIFAILHKISILIYYGQALRVSSLRKFVWTATSLPDSLCDLRLYRFYSSSGWFPNTAVICLYRHRQFCYTLGCIRFAGRVSSNFMMQNILSSLGWIWFLVQLGLEPPLMRMCGVW